MSMPETNIPLAPPEEEIAQPEQASQPGNRLLIAYHGLRAFIAERLMERSGSTMERMDHKDALYEDLDEAALYRLEAKEADANGEDRPEVPEPTATATGEPARPRTATERRIDNSMDNKSRRHAKAGARRKWVTGVYHGEATRRDGEPSKRDIRGRKVMADLAYKQGRITAAERRRANIGINANPATSENHPQHVTHKKLEKAEDKLYKGLPQPVSSRWRGLRRSQAIAGIKSHHRSAEKHRQAMAALRGEDQEMPEDPTLEAPVVPTNPITPTTPNVPLADLLDDDGNWDPPHRRSHIGNPGYSGNTGATPAIGTPVVPTSSSPAETRPSTSATPAPEEDEPELSPGENLWHIVEDEVRERVGRMAKPGEKPARDLVKRIRAEVREEALEGLPDSERQEFLKTFETLDNEEASRAVRLWQAAEAEVRARVTKVYMPEAVAYEQVKGRVEEDFYKRIRGKVREELLERVPDDERAELAATLKALDDIDDKSNNTPYVGRSKPKRR